ncbi:MAG: hypothetical protein ABUS79_02125 [Pseudomonadota bacterium]
MSLACATPVAYQPPQQVQRERAVATPKRKDAVEPLSPAVRAILKRRMVAHSRDMGDLVSAIMILDYPRIAERADGIVADLSLSRPVTQDATELNSSLPEKFYVHQDQIRIEAKGLSEAAKALDAYGVAEQYGRLSEGCVRCHADYRSRR